MIAYTAGVLCALVEILGRIAGHPPIGLSGLLKNAGYQKELTARLANARDLCIKHSWTETAHRILELEEYLSGKSGQAVLALVLQSKCDDLENHIFRLFNDSLFFVADNGRLGIVASFLEQRKEWNDAFPDASYEMFDSVQCFLHDLHTASVFHSMRALEIGLSSLGKRFNVSTDKGNWQNVIEQIEANIRKIDPTCGPNWKQDQKTFSDVAIHFMFLKDAWRNHVMHVRDTYDDKAAQKIFEHVGDFVKRLASLGLKETPEQFAKAIPKTNPTP